jgi:hypothetical protein
MAPSVRLNDEDTVLAETDVLAQLMHACTTPEDKNEGRTSAMRSKSETVRFVDIYSKGGLTQTQPWSYILYIHTYINEILFCLTYFASK